MSARLMGWSAWLLMASWLPAKIELKVQAGHGSVLIMDSAKFSHHGRWIISSSFTTTILWDVASGRELRSFEGRLAEFTPDDRFVVTYNGESSIRIWEAATGREVRRLDGVPLASLEFSPDGRLMATGELSGITRLWEFATGREIRRLEDKDSGGQSMALRVGVAVPGSELSKAYQHRVTSLCFSADGRFLVTAAALEGSVANGPPLVVARVWEVAGGREVSAFTGTQGLRAIGFSADGRSVMGVEPAGQVLFWDRTSGNEIRRLDISLNAMHSAAFSRDGRFLLTGVAGVREPNRRGAQLWDLSTGMLVRRFSDAGSFATSATFSYDGKRVVLCSNAGTRILNASSGAEERSFEGYVDGVQQVVFSPDGRYLLTISARNGDAMQLWETETGRSARFAVSKTWTTEVAFSPDSRYLVAGDGKAASLWDVATGRKVREFVGHSGNVGPVAFSPDSRFVLTGSQEGVKLPEAELKAYYRARNDSEREPLARNSKADNTVRLWEASTGRELRRFAGHWFSLKSVEFSPDGKLVLSAAGDCTVRLWQADSGQELRSWRVCDGQEAKAVFSPDGRFVLASAGNTVHVLDAVNGAELREFANDKDQRESIGRAEFSADGRFIVTRGDGHSTVRVWDFASGARVRDFATGSPFIASATFSPDGKFLFTWGLDGRTVMWDIAGGRQVATLCSFRDRGWVVTDAQNRYDASDPDGSSGLYWLLDNEVVELKQLKERFYTPGLLARWLGHSQDPLPDVTGLDDVKLWPAVEIVPPRPGSTAATIRLTNRQGGMGRVVVKVNGRQIALGARGQALNRNASVAELHADLGAAELKADGLNTIEVTAYEKNDLVSGRGVRVVWSRAVDRTSIPPTLHAVLVGVSNYDNPELNLTFAAKDAVDMAHAIEVAGKGLFGVERVRVETFSSGGGEDPQKEKIRKAFEEVAATAGPDDVFLAYFAGHGVAGKRARDTYYYLTRDARSLEPEKDQQLLARSAISSAELLEWLSRKGMPLRQVIILDTCAAGAANSDLLRLADRRELTADQRRAIELLKDATGSHILMGAAADKASYEATRYGQGLLTYALLAGMRQGEALDEGGRVDVRRWFDAAQRLVPELAVGIGGIQQPMVSSPGGQTFPIGLLSAEDRARVPLGARKPWLLRVLCQDDDDQDKLHLEIPLRTELRAANAPVARGEAAREPRLVYLDQIAGDVPDAFLPRVHYWVAGDGVRLRIRLLRGEEKVERMVEMRTLDLTAISRRVAQELTEMLAGQPGLF